MGLRAQFVRLTRFNLDAREGRILTRKFVFSRHYDGRFNLDAREGRILTPVPCVAEEVPCFRGFNLDAREGRILTQRHS